MIKSFFTASGGLNFNTHQKVNKQKFIKIINDFTNK